MLDAHAAVLAVSGVQASIAVTSTTPTAGQPVSLDAAPSLIPAGESIANYDWTMSDGGGIATGVTGATNGPTGRDAERRRLLRHRADDDRQHRRRLVRPRRWRHAPVA